MKYLMITICFLLSFSGYGQIKREISHYTTKDGLSHDGVLCITRDREGFMWFGTFDGLNRFDGHNFVVYKSRPGDSSKLRSNKVRDVVEDKAGYLWIQTFDYKVYRFDKATEQFLPIFDGPYKKLFNDQVIINKIIPDSINGIWLLTKDRGMYYVQSNRAKPPVITRYTRRSNSPFRIKGNLIKFHYTDTKGNIWIGTDAGLNQLRHKAASGYQVVPFNIADEQLLSSRAFTCVAQNAGTMYFGTSDGLLVTCTRLTKGFKSINIVKGVPLNDICAASAATIYISTAGKGLFRLDVAASKAAQVPMESNADYKSLYKDGSGNIWIEPDKYGVVKYNPATGVYKHFYQATDYSGANREYRVITDANGILWVSMKGGGFGYYNPANDKIDFFFDQPGSPEQKFSNVITCLYIDKTGVLWMSGKDGGVNKVISLTDKFNFRQPETQPKSRSENDVRAMLKDTKGRLWVCTKDGIVHVYEHDKPVNVFAGRSNYIGFVYCITQDIHKNIWLGTKGNGLFKASPANQDESLYTLTNYKNNPADVNSVSSNMIYSVMEDHKRRIWIGTFGGGLDLLTSINGKDAFKNVANTFHSYPISWAKSIRHLCEDNKGRIWIATSYGLVVFNPDEPVNGEYKFIAYKKIPGNASSLGNNGVQYICKDHTGQLWAGTFGGGLNKILMANGNIQHVKFKSITKADGLPNDVVLGITTDRQNNLWITTAGGLARLDPATGVIESYDPFSGATQNNFSEATCFTATDGTLYFGCVNGYFSFNPQSMVHKRMPANIAFTNLQVYYKNIVPGTDESPLKCTIDATQEVMLKHDQNVISIDYAVLDYRSINKISYSYKLEGFDKTWHTVNELQKATYTNIPPGNYTFYVKGASDALFSNVPQKCLKIIIEPPFYLTAWAYAIYFVLAVIIFAIARNIIITMIRLRNKVVVEKKLTEVKLAFFTNISHELRTPLTLIASPLQELSKAEKLSEKGQEYFKIINRNVNRMIRFTSQLLDFRKVQNGKMQINIAETDLVELINEVGGCFHTIAEEKNINFQIRVSEKELFAWVDAEKIEIIIYNLLSNAFKFSPPNKKIVLALTSIPDKELIAITVIDEGKGVPAGHLEDIFEIYHEEQVDKGHHLKGTGIGLALAKGLAISHKGKLWAELNEPAGMTFILQLKAGHEHFTPEEMSFSNRQPLVEQLSVVDELPLQPLQPATTADTHPSLILIVEDNADLRRFLEYQLHDFYQVLTAVDGADGLKVARSAYPDLIISDVMMPVMDGIQMLDAIKHDQAISHIPVILLTAKSSVESRINALNYGADVYLTKPFQNELLIASIENLLQSRKRMFEHFAIGPKGRETEPDNETRIPVTTLKDEQFLKDVIKIVEEKLGDKDFNIDEVALGMCMGRTTFYKKLKSLSSLSPVEFVKELQLNRSKQLLDTGMHTVSEVAYMAGFNSPAYFSTSFKEKYQVSPSAYLKKRKAEGF